MEVAIKQREVVLVYAMEGRMVIVDDSWGWGWGGADYYYYDDYDDHYLNIFGSSHVEYHPGHH